MSELLPDSRCSRVTGRVFVRDGDTLIPVHCANCGKRWGMVPEKLITFAFCLCEACAETHGDVAHTYKEPDAVFWERVRDAQLEEYGGLLDLPKLASELADSSSPMTKLADEWRAHVHKTDR